MKINEITDKERFVATLKADPVTLLLHLRDKAYENEDVLDDEVADVIELAVRKIQGRANIDWEAWSDELNDKKVSLLDNGKEIDYVSWYDLGMHSEYFDAEAIEEIAKHWKKVLSHK